MVYKVPDLNEIRQLSENIAQIWDRRRGHNGSLRFMQSIRPTKEFGFALPFNEGDSIVCHCVNGGDVFLALAARLDCDWIVSDIRSASLEHVRKKVLSPEFRFKRLIEDSFAYELYKHGMAGAAESKNKIKTMKNSIFEDWCTLLNRRVKYIEIDSNYFGLPSSYVDWHLSHEPSIPFLSAPTVLIEMLASSRKGAAFSFKSRNFSENDLSVFYKLAGLYGCKVDVSEREEQMIDTKPQEVTYVIIYSASELPAIDRKIIRYCSDRTSQNQTAAEMSASTRKPFYVNTCDAEAVLNLTSKQILDSLNRVDCMLNTNKIDCPYLSISI